MPELPDIELYLHALRPRIVGRRLEKIRLASPFLVRSFDPPIDHANGKTVVALRRLGKRLVWELEGDLFLVIHLMIAGRFRWLAAAGKIPGKVGLAAFDFAEGSLILTEAGSKRRASMYLVRGAQELAAHDPGGLEVLTSSAKDFGDALTRENHTLKRALTDPTIFSGIGNAYSDEILHAAKLSPMKQTRQLTESESARLHLATIQTLETWIERTRDEVGQGFPEKVTAFREGMAVHGRYGKPCPTCGSPVQRIVYASNECNYCATCQTEGRLLSDRALSRLLREDWPKTLEEMERRKH